MEAALRFANTAAGLSTEKLARRAVCRLMKKSLVNWENRRMKKNGILNSDISRVLSYMGHTDTLAVGRLWTPDTGRDRKD